MSHEWNESVSTALDEWQLRNIERDWDAVVSRAQAVRPPAQTQGARSLLARRRSYTRRIALVAVGLAVATPAIAAVSGSLSWPWSHTPGAELVASVPSPPGTSLRLDSHGALVVRTSHGIRFLSPAPAKQQRRFSWRLAAQSRIAKAEVVLGRGPAVELCSPCTEGESGTFTLTGSRALDVLNGHAKVRVRTGNQTTTAPIRLKRLR
jgi:hypothetical protein